MAKNNSFDFRELLEEKGIISSGSNSSKTGGKTLTLGSLLKDIIKDITTDPDAPREYSSTDTEEKIKRLFEDETGTNEVKETSPHENAERQRREEAAAVHKMEQRIRQEEERKKALKDLAEARKLKEEEERLKKQAEQIVSLQKSPRSISEMLRDKAALKQAFILHEIISKPKGLQ